MKSSNQVQGLVVSGSPEPVEAVPHDKVILVGDQPMAGVPVAHVACFNVLEMSSSSCTLFTQVQPGSVSNLDICSIAMHEEEFQRRKKRSSRDGGVLHIAGSRLLDEERKEKGG